ncbi:MAG: cytochrome c1 [Hyphomicrobiaceae bacterium]|nr:cytochrome c1 [Hyphomicrobiaceae bacterium]
MINRAVRGLGNAVGCLMLAAAIAGTLTGAAGPARAAGGATHHIERQDWSFAGFSGQHDTAQLRRGFQVYQEVCSACHGLERVYWRNLTEPGGPEFDVEAVKALAKEWPNLITDGPDDEGKMFERPALLSDPIRGPYKNDKEARASQNGALPPDLSLITRARSVHADTPWYVHVPAMAMDVVTGYQEGGADYTYALLTGYSDPPEGLQIADGMNYNKYYPGNQIGMVQPIAEGGSVTYQDNAGATSSLEQNAKDVTAFLAWAADPSLNARKRIGWQVMLYLLVTTFLLYIAKHRIWARVH